MDRHELKQLDSQVGELIRYGSPSCIRQVNSIMVEEFDHILRFALELTEPKPKPKHTIADNYPAGGLTATEPCMFCEDFEKLQAENERLKKQPRCLCGGVLEGLGWDIATKDEVWECKKCQSQIITKQALKEK